MAIDLKAVLDLPLAKENEAGAATVRGYLKALLRELWREEGSFSGKRPFGESGWKHDLYVPLVRAWLVAGVIDEDGFIEDVDKEAADNLILAAIGSLS